MLPRVWSISNVGLFALLASLFLSITSANDRNIRTINNNNNNVDQYRRRAQKSHASKDSKDGGGPLAVNNPIDNGHGKNNNSINNIGPLSPNGNVNVNALASTISNIPYYENATQDTYVGLGNPGDRVVWYNTTWVDSQGDYIASSSGHCLVLTTTPSFKYYCHYDVAFASNNSTLTFEGVSNDYGEPAAYMTITGGTGVLSEATGLVSSQPPKSVDADQIFINTVYLQ